MVGKEKYMQNIDKKLKVASQHKEEIPEQVRDDMNASLRGGFSVGRRVSVSEPSPYDGIRTLLRCHPE